MARITVEDCIDKFPSRFELVLIASNRARKLNSGDEPTVDKDNDKNTVIALREIAEESISIENLQNSLIEEHQTVSFNEEDDEDKEDDVRRLLHPPRDRRQEPDQAVSSNRVTGLPIVDKLGQPLT